MTEFTERSLKIQSERYWLDNESDPSHMFERVASTVAEAETNDEDKEKYKNIFYDLMYGCYFMPNSPTLKNAGSERGLLSACTVSGELEDSRESIDTVLHDAVENMSQGTGVGTDFSPLRPRGALIKSNGGKSSGPISFMNVFSYYPGYVIKQSAMRPGAQMGMLDITHPDAWHGDSDHTDDDILPDEPLDFVNCKRFYRKDVGPDHYNILRNLEGFNISFKMTDSFMRAVEKDLDWDLEFDGVIYRTVKARELWAAIINSAWHVGDPGLFFIDTVQRGSPMSWSDKITAVNPCLTADTYIETMSGPAIIKELVGREFYAIVDGIAYYSTGFECTGTREVVTIQTEEGYNFKATGNHEVLIHDDTLVCVDDLTPGDKIRIGDNTSEISKEIINTKDYNDGYILGLYIGDGVYYDKVRLDSWVKDIGSQSVRDFITTAFIQYKTRSDFAGWRFIENENKYSVSCVAFKTLVELYNLSNKKITDKIETASNSFRRGFLCGFFDADGSVQGDQQKGVSIRLTQSNLERLWSVQRMLLSFGIYSRIYTKRKPSGTKMLPDGHGGKKRYHVKATHELVISNDSIVIYNDIISFKNSSKKGKLERRIADYKRKPNQTKYIATIKSITPSGTQEVFDANVRGVGLLQANGIVVSNCGEVPLPPNGICNLGHLNLGKYVIDGEFDYELFGQHIEYGVRFLDNVVTVNNISHKAMKKRNDDERRIGLGVMGLADAFIYMDIRYGSEESLEFTEELFRFLSRKMYISSIKLAKERGEFPALDRGAFVNTEYIQRIFDESIHKEILEHGIRNCTIGMVAPTGTTSQIAGCSGAGIEPIYTWEMKRVDSLGETIYRVPIYDEYIKKHGEDARLPSHWVTAEDVNIDEEIELMEIVQSYLDGAISRTFNLPNSATRDDISEIYFKAWKAGLKGVTVFRDGCLMSGQVQTKIKPGKKKKRPKYLTGETRRAIFGDENYYLTINYDDDGRPREMFINSRNNKHKSWQDAVARLASSIMRMTDDPSFIAEQLQVIVDETGQFFEGKWVGSVPALIGLLLEEAMNGGAGANGDTVDVKEVEGGKTCPKCGRRTVIVYGGCEECRNDDCNYSKCG